MLSIEGNLIAHDLSGLKVILKAKIFARNLIISIQLAFFANTSFVKDIRDGNFETFIYLPLTNR
jgi:hypothetical protein